MDAARELDGAIALDGASAADGKVDGGPDNSCVELTALRDFKADPSGIGVLFTAVRCADKSPVAGLMPEDFEIAEDDKALSSEADPDFVPSRGRRVYISLLLDMSSSTLTVIDPLIAGAKDFVGELLEKRKINVFIGIELFDGAQSTTPWQLPIRDPARLKAKLDQLKTFKGTDANSTNLNGATIAAIASLQQRQQQVAAANDKGVVTQGYLVVFTDGTDTAGRRDVDAAAKAIVAANAGTRQLADGALPPVDTYAVALAGKDYKAETFAQLFTGTGAAKADAGVVADAGGFNLFCSDSCSGYTLNGRCEDGRAGAVSARCLPGTDCSDCRALDAGAPAATPATGLSAADARRRIVEAANPEELAKRFSDLALRIAGQLEGTYLLAYCSPKRMDMHKLTLRLKKATAPGSSGISFSFNANGFTGGCSSELFTSACDTKQCGGFNCGACDDETEACNATTDLCENACLAQNRCDGSSITNPLGYLQQCEFGLQYTQCNGKCIDGRSDELNCGKCGVACNPTSTCVEGVCTCPNAAQLSCSGAGAGCFDGQTDRLHCGSCTSVCPAQNPTGAAVACKAGACDCGAGFTFCGGSCVDTATDRSNCGGCGTVCSADATCSAGKCTCNTAGSTSCDVSATSKQQLCANLQSNTNHCGTCGKACGTGGACTAGACTCSGGTTLCDGVCVSSLTDSKHCGMCGRTCTATEQCVSGACAVSPFAACTSAVLSSAVPVTQAGMLGASEMQPECYEGGLPTLAQLFVAPRTATYTFTLSGLLLGEYGLSVFSGSCSAPVALAECTTRARVSLTAGQAVRVAAYGSQALPGAALSVAVTSP